MKGSEEKIEGASPDKMALIGVRNATYSEGETADNIDINESFIKMVVGKDEIHARGLFKACITFFPICKLNLLTNYKPDLNGDKSMRERVRYIFLRSSFVDRPDPKKLNEFQRDEDFVQSLTEEYLSEVFTWILNGAVEYYKEKSFTPPEEFQKKTDEFFSLQDSVTSFINKRLIITQNDKDFIKRTNLFEEYKTYCNDNSQKCRPRSTLFKRIDDLNIRPAVKDGYDGYRCVKLIEKKNVKDQTDVLPIKVQIENIDTEIYALTQSKLTLQKKQKEEDTKSEVEEKPQKVKKSKKKSKEEEPIEPAVNMCDKLMDGIISSP